MSKDGTNRGGPRPGSGRKAKAVSEKLANGNPGGRKLSVIDFGNEAMECVRVMPNIEGTQMETAFTHIFSGGYAAGYYSYKWSELLDADAFAQFQAARDLRGSIFDKKTANAWRKNVLERGGTDEPMNLYRAFRGGEPTIDALLKRDGIK